MRFTETRRLLKEFEKHEKSYGNSIPKQLDVIMAFMSDAGHSWVSGQILSVALIRRTHDYEGPYTLFPLDKLFRTPPYDGLYDVIKFIKENKKWAIREAKKELKKDDRKKGYLAIAGMTGMHMHPTVRAWYERIARGEEPYFDGLKKPYLKMMEEVIEMNRRHRANNVRAAQRRGRRWKVKR